MELEQLHQRGVDANILVSASICVRTRRNTVRIPSPQRDMQKKIILCARDDIAFRAHKIDFILLEAGVQPNIGFTIERVLTVFTSVTEPKNRLTETAHGELRSLLIKLLYL